jgi:hypothetical protein
MHFPTRNLIFRFRKSPRICPKRSTHAHVSQ